MPKFINTFDKPAHFEQALFLYTRYSKFLDDDYAKAEKSDFDNFKELIIETYPYFYLVLEDDMVSGFIYLDNITGNDQNFHGAEVSACFDKRFWGSYTKICAFLFLNFCFEQLGFKKIKACIYPENFRVKNLLKFAGFKKEGLLKGETMRNNKLQDIEIYACRKAE